MIRLVASDMDGTFVSYDGTVSKENMQAVQRLQEKGIIFTAASGRSREGIMHLFENEGITVECICANGAQYFDRTGTLLKEAYLPLAKSQKIIEVFRKHDIHYMIFASIGVCTDQNPDLEAKAFEERVYRRFGMNPALAHSILPMKHVEDIGTLEIMKIEGYDMDPELLQVVREDMLQIEGINALSAAVDNLEVTDEEASKGRIIERVCSEKGISKDEVLVLGDGLNDITMFECFRHSAAIGNSVQAIRDLAEIIDPDPVKGFANVINSILDHEA